MRFYAIIIGLLSILSLPAKSEARYWRIDIFDSKTTGVYRQILDGSIEPRVTRQYMTVKPNGEQELDVPGRDRSLEILRTKYAPSCKEVGCSTR